MAADPRPVGGQKEFEVGAGSSPMTPCTGSYHIARGALLLLSLCVPPLATRLEQVVCPPSLSIFYTDSLPLTSRFAIARRTSVPRSRAPCGQGVIPCGTPAHETYMRIPPMM